VQLIALFANNEQVEEVKESGGCGKEYALGG
jgi:hypothetical protein